MTRHRLNAVIAYATEHGIPVSPRLWLGRDAEFGSNVTACSSVGHGMVAAVALEEDTVRHRADFLEIPFTEAVTLRPGVRLVEGQESGGQVVRRRPRPGLAVHLRGGLRGKSLGNFRGRIRGRTSRTSPLCRSSTSSAPTEVRRPGPRGPRGAHRRRCLGVMAGLHPTRSPPDHLARAAPPQPNDTDVLFTPNR